MAAFDSFATNYQDLVTRSIRMSGESPDYFADYKAAYIARRIAAKKAGTILDYGCGVGLLSERLKKSFPGAQIDGYDVSNESILRVAGNLLSQGVFTTNVDQLDCAYELIVLSNVLHHVKPKERPELIVEACSRLAIGGKLVVFEHNPINPLTRWAVSQCPFDEDAVLLSNEETRRYFQRDPLRLMWRDYIVFFPRWLKWLRPVEPLLRRCPLGAQYAVVGERVQ